MLQMEVATWAPKDRQPMDEAGANYIRGYIKEHGAFPVSIGNPQYKPGLQQIWWDAAGHRSFGLWYDPPGYTDPRGSLKEYEPMLDIMNFELVTLIEVGELLEDAGYAYWKHTKYSRPSKRPRIQMEIATWAPENRKEVMKRRAEYIKKYEPFPVSIHDPQYKSGIHMIWSDVSSNRSFCLIYDLPGFDDAKGILNEYKPGLDRMNFELFNVLEIHDYLEYAGK